MNLISQLLRTAPSALAVAIALAVSAAPASAAPEKKQIPGHKHALLNFASCAKPIYPAEALKAKREGTVEFSFEIDADGKLLSSKVDKSSGHTDLDETALAAINKCKFSAASQDGKPIADSAKVKYVWTLK